MSELDDLEEIDLATRKEGSARTTRRALKLQTERRGISKQAPRWLRQLRTEKAREASKKARESF